MHPMLLLLLLAVAGLLGDAPEGLPQSADSTTALEEG